MVSWYVNDQSLVRESSGFAVGWFVVGDDGKSANAEIESAPL